MLVNKTVVVGAIAAVVAVFGAFNWYRYLNSAPAVPAPAVAPAGTPLAPLIAAPPPPVGGLADGRPADPNATPRFVPEAPIVGGAGTVAGTTPGSPAPAPVP